MQVYRTENNFPCIDEVLNITNKPAFWYWLCDTMFTTLFHREQYLVFLIIIFHYVQHRYTFPSSCTLPVFSVSLNLKINLDVKGLCDEGQLMWVYCPFIMLALFLMLFSHSLKKKKNLIWFPCVTWLLSGILYPFYFDMHQCFSTGYLTVWIFNIRTWSVLNAVYLSSCCSGEEISWLLTQSCCEFSRWELVSQNAIYVFGIFVGFWSDLKFPYL